MEKEQKEKLHAVRIPCNSTVKNYTFATLKRLGLDEKPGKVYNDIVSGNGAIPKSVYATTTKAKTLLEMIPKFHPPVPVTAAEMQEYDALIEQWGTHIKTQMNDAFSVIYLCDEVNKVLQKKNSTVRCQRKHLVWCLSLLGESAMTPKGVADAILKYDGTDWENLPQLENDDKYYVRLNDDSDEEKQKFLDTVEFIYALSSSAADASLVEKIQNDIEVLTEFSGWGDALTDYKYVERYKEFAGRLQTLPAALSKKFKVTKKQIKYAAPKKQEITHEEEQYTTTTEKEEVMESSANESTEQPSVDEKTTDSSATVENQSEENKTIEYDMGITPLDRAQTKIENDLPLDPDEQLALVKIHECPICGGDLVEKTGLHREYISHRDSKPCPYIAWGTFEKPEIHEKYNKPVERKK